MPLFFNLGALAACIPFIWWLFKSRQQLTLFFTVILLVIFLVNNPLPETTIITLQSLPCEFTDNAFKSDILGKLTDNTVIRKVTNCYIEDALLNKYTLRKNLTAEEKKALQEIFRAIPYNGTEITFWAPAFLEPGIEQPLTMAIEYKGEAKESTYRISTGLNKDILMSGNSAAKEKSNDHESNILFQGAIKKDEIFSKKIYLRCLKQDWQKSELQLKLEKLIISGASEEWVEEGSGKLTIKKVYQLNSFMPRISGIIALATAILTLFLKLIEIWQKKQDNM